MPKPHLPQDSTGRGGGGAQPRRPRSSSLRTPKDTHSLRPGREHKPHPALGALGQAGGIRAPACKTLRSPLPSSCLLWCLLSSLLLPFLVVHVGRVVAMTPRAGGRLWRLFRPNPHAQSPGGRGAAAAPPPVVQMRGEIGRRSPSYTPEPGRGSSSWK